MFCFMTFTLSRHDFDPILSAEIPQFRPTLEKATDILVRMRGQASKLG